MTDGLPDGTPQPAKRRILLVEDNFLVALALEAVLMEQGYDLVGPLGTVAEAVQAAEAEAIDAAILDFDVAGEAVTPVIDILHRRGIRFLIFSGLPGHLMPIAGAAGYLRKPVARAELRAALDRLFQEEAGSAPRGDRPAEDRGGAGGSI